MISRAIVFHTGLVCCGMAVCQLFGGAPAQGRPVAGEKPDEGTKPPAKPRLTVGLIQSDTKSPWKAAQTKSILKEAQKRGIALQIVDALGRQDAQVKAIYEFISQRVDAVVVAPAPGEGWKTVLEGANKAGLPIVFLVRGIASAGSTPRVHSNPKKQGGRVAGWLAATLGEKGRVAVLSGDGDDFRTAARRKGLEEALKGVSGMELIAGPKTGAGRLEGKKAMRVLLDEHGDRIGAVFAVDELLALGAIQAIEEAGRAPGTDILVVSIGGCKEALEAVDAGRLNATVERTPDCGGVLLDVIEGLCEGKDVAAVSEPANAIFHPGNVDEHVIKDRPY